MNRQFLDKIDELSLRSKLNEDANVLNDVAWQKFEQYLSKQKSKPMPSPWRGLNLKINRAYLLPGVFAAMILLLSLLLYNFMSIRIPDKISSKIKKTGSPLKTLRTKPPLPKNKISELKSKALPLEAKATKLNASIIQTTEPMKIENQIPVATSTEKILIRSTPQKHERLTKKALQTKKDSLVVVELLPELKPVYSDNSAEFSPPENVPE